MPFSMTADLAQRVEACGALGMSVDEIYALIDVPRETVSANPEVFARCLERGKRIALAKMSEALHKKASTGSRSHAVGWRTLFGGYSDGTMIKAPTFDEVQQRFLAAIDQLREPSGPASPP